MSKKLMMLAALASSAMLTRGPQADEAERRQPQVGRQEARFASFEPSSYDATARTVEAVLSAGTAVRRYYFTEELVISDEAIDLGRVEQGLVCLLDAHNAREANAVLGRVSNVRIENGALIGTLHFGDTERARAVEGMVSRGELKGVSIGYKVTKWEIVRTDDDKHETWRAAAWELLEVSLVPVPADANAGVRSIGGSQAPGTGAEAAIEEEEDMIRSNAGGAAAPAITAPSAAPAADAPTTRATPQAPASPPAQDPAQGASRFGAADGVAFVDQARSLGVETRARELLDQNERGEIGVEAARSALLTAAAEAQRAATSGTPGGPTVAVNHQANRQNEEASRNAIVGAIVARCLGEQPAEGSGEYMGYRLLEIARERAGLNPRERDAITILRAANASSDFPLLLEAAGNRVLLARYQAASPTYQAIAARRDLTDFKETKLLRVGDFPTLQPYKEDGEIKAGSINEGRETVILGSYGRILRLSRQAIVNDDLGAFDQVFGSIGTMVARFENATFYAMKAQNSGAGPKLADGVNLFHANHGNLAGTGGAIAVDTLGAGRAAMRKQKDIDGNAINIGPKTILVGPDQETLAEQLLAPIQPQQAGNVNPFSGKLQIVCDASIAGNGWELYADPAQLPVFHYGYLADAPGPRVMTEEGFNVDGMSFRVTEDFYVGATDHRGAYRNAGA